MRVRISRFLLDRIVAEAAASADEVCGLLLGEMSPREGGGPDCVPAFAGTHVAAALPYRNVAGDPSRRFEIDPAALITAHRASRNGGPPIVGHYHSHPGGDPRPSPHDAAAAHADGAIWLIVSGQKARAWRAVRDGAVHGRFDPVDLAVHPGCAPDSASSQGSDTFVRDHI